MATSDFLLFLHNCSVAETIDPACPALAPPPGELPLDPNASTLLTTALGVLVTCCILIVVGMIVRVFTRAYIVRTVFALEDALMILATVNLAPIAGLQLRAYHYGGSKHQWNVTVGDLYIALRYVYAVQILYCFAMYAAKLSILLQIKQIFEGTRQRKTVIFWASWTVIILVSSAYIATLMVLIFSCTPVRKAWDPLLPGRCRVSAAGYVSSAVNLTSDIAVLLLPVLGVAKLQMATRKKIAVCAVFATGLIACAASAVRLYFSSKKSKSDDKTYWLALVGLFGAVEIAMVILCGCFTSFPRFFKWVRGDRTGAPSYGSTGHKSRSCGSESRSMLRSDVPIELRRIGVKKRFSRHGRAVKGVIVNNGICNAEYSSLRRTAGSLHNGYCVSSPSGTLPGYDT